jgi:hypothetical protein
MQIKVTVFNSINPKTKNGKIMSTMVRVNEQSEIKGAKQYIRKTSTNYKKIYND